MGEEIIPIHGIELTFRDASFKSFHIEPDGKQVQPRSVGEQTTITLPALEIHQMLVAEYKKPE
ncbi:MAG TPA: hypothetical protein VHC22_20125 [Pirellulales bacterium]|nr:hypothetical protein [Pirellulales bacterium]